MLDFNKFDKIIVANWKLNASFDFIRGYFNELNRIQLVSDKKCIVFCPPPIYLNNCKTLMNLEFFLGAQDCSIYEKGAYTGEISAEMLKDNQCQFCIIGHSERRQIFKDSNEIVQKKAKNLLKSNIYPILCVGETLEEKEKGKTFEIIEGQIKNSIPDNGSNNNIIIAYEPIWAIGTGLTPTFEDIDEIHTFIKEEIKGYKNFKILYGGSVKSSNSNKIMNLKNVNGVLVGGASLDPKEYVKICNF